MANDKYRLVRERAISFLARREHARLELARKLARHEVDGELIETVLNELEKLDLLNEGRYVEALVNSKIASGYGPISVIHHLTRVGIEVDNIRDLENWVNVNWSEVASRSRSRHFGAEIPDDMRAIARQSRYLYRKGFTTSHIEIVFKNSKFDYSLG